MPCSKVSHSTSTACQEVGASPALALVTRHSLSWQQVVVEFSVRRGPNSAAAGEVFRPHQAFVRAVHTGTGAAATFRSKVTLLPGTPPNPLNALVSGAWLQPPSLSQGVEAPPGRATLPAPELGLP
jgi:hypothetical protein